MRIILKTEKKTQIKINWEQILQKIDGGGGGPVPSHQVNLGNFLCKNIQSSAF